MVPKLLIASNNPDKVAEFRDLLDGCGWEVVSPGDVGVDIEVEETGSTYAENARIKAAAFAGASGLVALADDSGLEVDDLNGEPGPLHHVRGWDGIDNNDRILLLLRVLSTLRGSLRQARYRAVIVVALPDGTTLEASGSCNGVIIDTPTGSNGFGYDPIFFLPERNQTMAQLTRAEKNQISHRAVAAAKLRERLKELAASGG